MYNLCMNRASLDRELSDCVSWTSTTPLWRPDKVALTFIEALKSGAKTFQPSIWTAETLNIISMVFQPSFCYNASTFHSNMEKNQLNEGF